MFITIYLVNDETNNSSLQLIEFLMRNVSLLINSNIISTIKLIKENQYDKLRTKNITHLPALDTNKEIMIGLNAVLNFLNKAIKGGSTPKSKVIKNMYKSLSFAENSELDHLNQGLQGITVDTRGKNARLIMPNDDNDDENNVPNKKNLMDSYMNMQKKRNEDMNRSNKKKPPPVINNDNVFSNTSDPNQTLKQELEEKAKPENFTDGDDIMKRYFEANSETII